jgi:hypothetical protein
MRPAIFPALRTLTEDMSRITRWTVFYHLTVQHIDVSGLVMKNIVPTTILCFLPLTGLAVILP